MSTRQEAPSHQAGWDVEEVVMLRSAPRAESQLRGSTTSMAQLGANPMQVSVCTGAHMAPHPEALPTPMRGTCP